MTQQDGTTTTATRIPTGWMAVVSDPKVWGAIAGAFGAYYAAKNMGADLPPDQRLQLYQTAMYSIGGVIIAVIAALGYQTGKLYEGAIPKGFVPTGGSPAATEIVSSSSSAPLAGQTTVTTTVPTQNASSVTDAAAKASNGMRSLLILLCCAIFFAAAGCATSEPFKRTIAPITNLAADEFKSYAANDQSISADAKSTRSRDADELKASVADPKTISVDVVDREWQDVASPYREYIARDPTLTTPEDKEIRNATPDKIDTLIAAEKKRRWNFFGLFGGGGSPTTTNER